MSPQRPILSLILIIISLGFCFGSEHEHSSLLARRYSRSKTSKASRSQASVNVDDYGAMSRDGKEDTEAFKKAWNEACSKGAVLVVPENKVYHLKPIKFSGPCQPNTTFMVYGTIKAWPHLSAYEEDPTHWIQFEGITGLRVDGGGIGTFNGNGKKWWKKSCKVNKSLPCTDAPTAVTFDECTNLIVKNLRFKNSQKMHINIQNCLNVMLTGLKVIAPEDSPNTDGIHVTRTKNILISNSFIGTGDDCISIESGSRNVKVTDITCGPGHGISIGSLGDDKSKAEVSNVVVNRAKLRGTTNGVRIKTWQGGSGYARFIEFMNIEMENVSNPIIIDQNYCDQEEPCHEQESAVKLSNLLYQNISGTSASEVAIKFDCSKTVPCNHVYVENVRLEAEGGGQTTASCDNVIYVNQGNLFPKC
ncbi:polygalacturonase-like [Neltuma alba]|uniref:polygalacturonase-like n=1 Tax=Neltuma alba TaxID=207710 RepID=UPI0010A4E14F|nr:polygalacturonase-like [Prosopis alba]